MSLNRQCWNYFNIIFFGLISTFCAREIVVFKSSLQLDNQRYLSGLRLKTTRNNQPIQSFKGFSLCGRFNYQRLLGSQTRLFFIKDHDWQLFFFKLDYDESFVSFGNVDHTGSAPSWINGELPDSNFVMWSTQRWHSVCFSFKASNSYVAIVKVCVKQHEKLNCFTITLNMPLEF